jgi:hypothetical protein
LLKLRIALSFLAAYLLLKPDFLLVNGNLCSRNGVVAEHQAESMQLNYPGEAPAR